MRWPQLDLKAGYLSTPPFPRLTLLKGQGESREVPTDVIVLPASQIMHKDLAVSMEVKVGGARVSPLG